MQLHQINRLHAEAEARFVDRAPQTGLRVAVRISIRTTPVFCRHHDAFLAPRRKVPDPFLAAARTIDIGRIEKRVENLEYYTSLSLLEQDAISKQDLTILDTQNVPRFKNGIIVDSFKGHSVADITNNDYAAAIDPVNKELRPSFNISAHNLRLDGSSVDRPKSLTKT
jgi:hypothetical protein